MSEPEASPSAVRRTALRWRRWLPRALFESGLIIFSVVLALALTGWAEDRRMSRRADDMRGFLIEEMKAVYLEDLTSQEQRQLVLYDRAIADLGGEPAPDASNRPDDAAPAKG